VSARAPARGGPAAHGELAILLHTHMPYVEGFGTWPFGEEWLWEAIATSYLPLLQLLQDGAPLTLSLTPVLCDQLEAPGAMQRCLRFLREVRPASHARDISGMRAAGDLDLAAVLDASAADYERAAERLAAVGDLLGALGRFAAWTSSATHAVLPLLATEAGVRLQVAAGVHAHRARFGAWRGGFWLPECAHAQWLDPLLEELGVHACCVDLTDVHGLGAPAQLTPLRSAAGPLLVPIDRATVELVWSPGGYPAAAPYRDSHRRTTHHHHAHANGGGTYDVAAARRQAQADAADFIARVSARLKQAADALGRPALAVCALDTELLGHWWHEGVWWLEAVVKEAERQRLALVPLDDALERHEPVPAPDSPLPVTSWGSPRTLATWSGPAVADFAWGARAAELRTLAASVAAPPRALRELLALQSSDWAFITARELAGDYGRERAAAHGEALEAALGDIHSRDPRLRNLAPRLEEAVPAL
jgi:1,4-alpha-glucan branching enzyme